MPNHPRSGTPDGYAYLTNSLTDLSEKIQANTVQIAKLNNVDPQAH